MPKHNKTRSDLIGMKVFDLKALVRKHNLDNAITRYSTMKKEQLIDALMKHSTRPNLVIEKEPKAAVKKRVKKVAVPPAVKKSKDVKLKKLTSADIADLSKSIPKRKGKRIVVESDDDEDDFFANIEKGKGAIKKTTLSASYLASKKALRESRLKPAAKPVAKPVAKPAVPKGSPIKIIEQYLGDFEKLKRMIFDQRRKVKGEEKEFLSDTVDRLNSIVDKYAPEDATIKASVNTGLKQPTLTELGLSGAVPKKDWVKLTKKVVNAFIKANEKTMRDEIGKQKTIIREKKIADKLGETKEKALEKERIRDQKRADKVAANEAKRKEIGK